MLYIVANLSIDVILVSVFCLQPFVKERVRGKISVLRSWYINTPFMISHVENRYFPKEGCNHPFGASRIASNGV